MRILPSKTGQFAQRPHFEAGEIDIMCATELHKVELYPSAPGPVRIDRFLEKRFGITVSYDDLPPGVLGYTRFGPSSVEAIVISKQLDDEDSTVAERRIRSTMAHEAGHGLMHLHFINLSGASCPLFVEQPAERRVLCRDEHAASDSSGRYSGQWWEYQANQAIGGLLMPRSLVQKLVEPYLIDGGRLISKPIVDPAHRSAAISAIVDTFNVNPAAARFRLAAVFPEDASGQLSL